LRALRPNGMSRYSQNGNAPRLASVGARPDHDFHVLIERGQELHQAFDREVIEAIVLQGRNFGLRNAQQRRDFPLFQLAAFQQFIDGQRQARFGLPLRGNAALRLPRI